MKTKNKHTPLGGSPTAPTKTTASRTATPKLSPSELALLLSAFPKKTPYKVSTVPQEIAQLKDLAKRIGGEKRKNPRASIASLLQNGTLQVPGQPPVKIMDILQHHLGIAAPAQQTPAINPSNASLIMGNLKVYLGTGGQAALAAPTAKALSESLQQSMKTLLEQYQALINEFIMRGEPVPTDLQKRYDFNMAMLKMQSTELEQLIEANPELKSTGTSDAKPATDSKDEKKEPSKTAEKEEVAKKSPTTDEIKSMIDEAVKKAKAEGMAEGRTQAYANGKTSGFLGGVASSAVAVGGAAAVTAGVMTLTPAIIVGAVAIGAFIGLPILAGLVKKAAASAFHGGAAAPAAAAPTPTIP
jgi:hypothetical protein